MLFDSHNTTAAIKLAEDNNSFGGVIQSISLFSSHVEGECTAIIFSLSPDDGHQGQARVAITESCYRQ